MPIFVNSKRKVLVIVPHKCGFTSFRYSEAYEKISMRPPNWRQLVKYSVYRYSVYQVFRNPVSRTLSAFKDKFRLMSKWIGEENFRWAVIHEIFWEVVGLDPNSSDERKAEWCLDFTFDDYMEALPRVYHRDPHMWPQFKFGVCMVRGKIPLTFPGRQVVRLEEIGSYGIPEFESKNVEHSSASVTEKIEVNQVQLDTIHRLYQKDFEIGGYPSPVAACEIRQ